MKAQITSHVIVDATETTTSAPFSLENAEKVSFVFQRSDHSSGSSAFKLQISVDGTNWIDYAELIPNINNSPVEQLSRVTTVTISDDNTAAASKSMADTYPLGRIVVTETTDGTHNAWVIIQY